MEEKEKRFLLSLAAIALFAIFVTIGLSAADSSSAEDQLSKGDTFEGQTIEGITLTYYVASSTTVYVGDGSAIYIGDAPTMTIPFSVTYEPTSTTYSVVAINKYAFYYCDSLESVSIPNTVQWIGESAFEGTGLCNTLNLPTSLTAIDAYAFLGTSISSVSIPDSVTSIDSEAFAYCPNLTTVFFGEGLIQWGYGLFTGSPVTTVNVDPDHLYLMSDNNVIFGKGSYSGCLFMFPSGFTGTYTVPDGIWSINNYAFYGCSLTGIIFPSSITSISVGYYAFSTCYSLTSATIDSADITIGEYAFSYTGLTTLSINNNVTSVGEGAFSYCESLTSLTIDTAADPNNTDTNTIGDYAFNYCTKLQTVIIGQNTNCLVSGVSFIGCTSLTTFDVSSNIYYRFVNNALYCSVKVGETSYVSLACYPAGSPAASYTVPTNIKIILPYAFAYSKVTSVSMTSVILLGTAAFKGCSDLQTADLLGTGTIKILDNAFEDCISLESVSLENVTSIGNYAFSGCTSLQSVTGDNVTELGDGAFFRCLDLESASFTNSNLVIKSTSDEKGLFEMCTSLTSVSLPSTLKALYHSMFYGCKSLTSLSIPSSVTTIEDSALSGTGLTSVSLPGGLLTIGDYAFYGCYSLGPVTIPNSVTEIGDHAFYRCSSMTSVTIGSKVSTIGEYAFYMSGLTSFIATGTVTSVGEGAFKYCRSLAAAYLPGITAVPNELFYGCTSLASFEIGEDVKSIGYRAFYGCTAFSALAFNAKSCNDLEEDACAFENTGLFAVVFGDLVTKVPDYLFFSADETSYTKVISITIGSKVASIGISSFAACLELETFIFNSTSYPNGASIANRLQYAGRGIESGLTVVIGNNVTAVKDNLFNYTLPTENAPYITRIVIGENVATIGSSAFAGNLYLTSIEYNAKSCYDLTSSKQAFLNCGSERDGIVFKIGSGVTAIPTNLFYSADSENSPKVVSIITVNASDVVFRGNIFYNAQYLTSIDVSSSTSATFNPDSFSGCSSITTVVTGSGMVIFKEGSFCNCTGLKTLTVGTGAATFEKESFMNCTSLESIIIDTVMCNVGVDAFDGAGTSGDGIAVTFGDHAQSVPNRMFYIESGTAPKIKSVHFGTSITFIGDYAFYNCGIQSMDGFPVGLDSIGNYAFCRTQFGSIVIPDTVTRLGDYAFYYCAASSVTIGSGVNNIGSKVFEGCSLNTINFNIANCGSLFGKDMFKDAFESPGLTVTFGSNVTNVPDYMFHGSLIAVPMTVVFNNVQVIGKYSFYGMIVQSLVLPDSVTTIGECAFFGCSELTSVSMGRSITDIGSSAFNGCISLETLYFNAENCPDLEPGNNIFVSCSHVMAVIFGDSVDRIPANLFSTTSSSNIPNVTTVTISGSVTQIAPDAFADCKMLTDISVDSSNAQYSSDCGVLFDKDMTTLILYPSNRNASEYTVPDGVTTLSKGSFDSCMNLTKLVIASMVTSTSDGAVKGCTNLIFLTIPSSITSLTGNDFTGLRFYSDSTLEEQLAIGDTIGYTFKGTSGTALVKNITITFDTHGGSYVAPLIEEAGATIAAPDSPTRTGYVFSKWQYEGQDYVFYTMPDENITLDAVWIANTYPVTLDKNGGTEGAAFTATYGSKLPAFTALTRIGYTLKGYYTEKTSGVMVIDKDGVLQSSIPDISDDDGNWACDSAKTFYAQWEPNKYTVTFDPNTGGTPSPESMIVTYDSAYGMLASVSKTGYRFDGWFTDAEEGTLVESTTVCKITSDQTLYAHWTANEYTVVFASNTGGTPTPTSKKVTYDSAYGTLAEVSKTGYRFDGWYTDPINGTLVKPTTICKTAEDHTLYAHWTPNEYTVVFAPNDGDTPTPISKKVTYDSAYGTLATVTRTGYTFAGWYTDPTNGTLVEATTICKTASDHNLYAHWTPNKYTVTFDSNKGGTPSPESMIVTYDSAYGELAAVTKIGYTFAGWYTDPANGTLVEATTICKTAGDHYLYAHWTPKTCTVTFNPNNGSTPSPASKEVTYDSAYGTLAVTVRTGYDFAGWYTHPTSGVKVEEDTICKNASNHKLYAHWTAKEYTVEFDSNKGGTPSPESKEVTYDGVYGTLATVSRTGYDFAGWYTDPTEGTLVETTTICKTASDHKLYAHWTAKEYTVVFVQNEGATPTPISKKVTYDSEYGPLAVTVRAGYDFAGWYTDPTEGTLVESTTIC